MGEKLNEVPAGGPQVAQAAGGSGTTTATPVHLGRVDSPPDEGPGPSGEITFPDGSKTRVTDDGRFQHTDASGRTGEWIGSDRAYWDPQTGEWMPEGWGDPGFENRETMNASDWEHQAGKANDMRRMAQQAGEEDLANWYQEKYTEAVDKAREVRANEGRG